MKIRAGFVSNSSSSSYVIRAAEYTVEELIDMLGIGLTYDDPEDAITDMMEEEGLRVYHDGGRKNDVLLLGVSESVDDEDCYVDISDGVISGSEDEKIIKALEKLGIKSPVLKTYINHQSG